jgi:hypothetical protein
MNLLQNLRVLTEGLIDVVIETKAYAKDDRFMEIYSEGDNLKDTLKNYLSLEKYCYFLKRSKLFYRTEEELNDIFSDAFIEAFFRGGCYPVKSFKGFNMADGNVRSVRLSKFLKDSLCSKVITINTLISERKKLEIAENRLSTGEDGSYDFESFLAFNGVESVDVVLEDSVELDECDTVLKELSDLIFPQVSYAMLLKDYEISQDEFQSALKYQMNITEIPSASVDKFNKLTGVIGNVMLYNKEKLGSMFGLHRLNSISAS